MDQIKKFIRLLDAKQRAVMLKLLQQVVQLELKGLDVKALKGQQNLYRVRKGKIRIVFRKEKNHGVPISIRYRDKAYR